MSKAIALHSYISFRLLLALTCFIEEKIALYLKHYVFLKIGMQPNRYWEM